MTFETFLYAAGLISVGGLLCIVLGGYVVGWAITYFLANEPEANGGMRGAGRAIGWAERTLIYVFILGNAPTAIGLLVAAKSIMRIGDISGDGQDPETEDAQAPKDDDALGLRAVTEYVIFGTLASFAWGVSVAYLIRWILLEWIVSS